MRKILLLFGFLLFNFFGFAQSESDSTYTYTGDEKRGLRHGQGVCYWEDGRRFVGGFRNDEIHGHGKMIYPNGDVYKGEWRNGLKHGRGTYTWKSGDVYEGSYRSGKRSGFGVYKSTSGSKYEGDWLADQAHGEGVLYDTDGSKYEGEWKLGKKNGNGVLIYKDGGIIQGQWKDDKYQPCNCPDTWSIRQAYDAYEAVFIGRVVSISKLDKDTDEISLEIQQYWKGKHGFKRRVIVQANYSSCDLIFFEGESYLIMANKNMSGFYQATQCFSGVASQRQFVIKGLESLDCVADKQAVPYPLRENEPVCGCNNVTYSNSSEAAKAGIRYWKAGRCKEDE